MEKEEGVNSVYHIWILSKREKILYCLREKQKENKKEQKCSFNLSRLDFKQVRNNLCCRIEIKEKKGI